MVTNDTTKKGLPFFGEDLSHFKLLNGIDLGLGEYGNAVLGEDLKTGFTVGKTEDDQSVVSFAVVEGVQILDGNSGLVKQAENLVQSAGLVGNARADDMILSGGIAVLLQKSEALIVVLFPHDETHQAEPGGVGDRHCKNVDVVIGKKSGQFGKRSFHVLKKYGDLMNIHGKPPQYVI